MSAKSKKSEKKFTLLDLIEKKGCKRLTDVLKLNEDAARDAVLAFLEQKHVGENGFFLLDHERYQIVEAFVDKSRMPQQLFELYVKPDAKLELNLPVASRKVVQTAFTEGYDLTKAARFFDTLNMRRCRLSQNVSNINTVFAKATVEVSKILDEYWNEFLASSWANDTPIDASTLAASGEKARAEDDWRRRMPTDFERKKKLQYIEANEDPSGSVWYCNRCVLVDAEFVTATACCSCSATRHCRTTEDYDSEDSDAASV